MTALLLQGCGEPGLSNVTAPAGGATPVVDFGARGSVSKGGPFGSSPAVALREPEVFADREPPAMASAQGMTDDDGRIRVADAGNGIGTSGGGFTLNFDNADVGAVSKSILGDILKANYVVDKRVVGEITLTSAAPVPRARLVPLLESALETLGAVIIKDQDLYRIVPSADPGGLGAVDARSASEGFGTSVVTARFMPAANLGHLLEGLGGRPGSVRTDPGTNLVIVQGSASERRAALEAAAMVDVDWMRSKSVAILPVANAAPETVIAELNHILDSGEGGRGQGAVQLQPMTRMNAVLAIARQPAGLDRVRTWIARLDHTDAAATGVKVYRLRYAQAKEVATALNALFGAGGASSGGGDTDASEPGGVSPKPASGTPAASQPGAGRQGADAGGVPSHFDSPKPAQDGESASAKAIAAMGDTDGLKSGGGANAKIRVTADPASNALLINASAADYRMVERAIGQMDRQPLQVAIDATIAEVTLSDQLQYGIQFFLQGKTSLGLSGLTSVPAQSASTAGLNLLAGGLSDPRVLLNALQGYTTVKILSSPSLVVLDRQPAVLQVGDEVPILTKTAQSVDGSSTAPVVNNIDYKNTGIILNVLPKINANGIVSLDIEQQISAVTTTDPTSLTPTISQRRVRSSVAVANGQTVMLAGLISDSRSSDRSGLPGLGSIRFLNDILTTHDSALHRTEIIIFIKPRIIATGRDAQDAAEEFRDRLLSMKAKADGSAERPD